MDESIADMCKIDPNALNGLELAYLGDAVIELLAREHALKEGVSGVGRLNTAVSAYVRATCQSEAVARLEGLLTEEETSFYKRGRNAHGNAPKSASPVEYRRATGLEALFAYLYLKADKARMYELFETAYKAE